MLAAQRREFLLARLATDRRVVTADVARELGTPEDTIRRDLRDLAAAGLCQRVYGGALPSSPAIADYQTRQSIQTDGKKLVARTAAAMISDEHTVLLDGGTTALEVARALPPALRATIVTHSPTVAAALAEHPAVEIYLLGGRLFKHSVVTCGAAAVEAAQGVRADMFFLGVTGVHPDAGLTTGDADEAAMKRALAQRAAETYVLASAEKIGTASRFGVLGVEAVAGIITDAPDDELLRRLARATTVLAAGPGSPGVLSA
ncbi:DeoR/GlpR family DNA-binding transcription regulator [Hamadaea tsunoensis]|uniref:DeoR/GlpR family DNA-binding transcription regulator n=1 Tax=Hamadaea tsunoensis TaxID=53368 RepID=UPI00040D3A2C|nr:DeoR/GlpR family DNA-binding transcription regulator [Hamadaea tsunoensis]